MHLRTKTKRNKNIFTIFRYLKQVFKKLVFENFSEKCVSAGGRESDPKFFWIWNWPKDVLKSHFRTTNGLGRLEVKFEMVWTWKRPLCDEKWPFWSRPKSGSNSTLPALNALRQPKNRSRGSPKIIFWKLKCVKKWLRKSQEVSNRSIKAINSNNRSKRSRNQVSHLRPRSEPRLIDFKTQEPGYQNKTIS